MFWEKICKSKSEGDLGFRNLEFFNQAMVAKQGWRILQQPDSLVSRLLKEKFFRHFVFMAAKKDLAHHKSGKVSFGASRLLY